MLLNYYFKMVNFVSGEFHLNFLKKRETAGEKVHPLGFNSFCSEHYYRNEQLKIEVKRTDFISHM